MIPYKSESNADLEFQFPDDILFEELDKQGVKLPKMKLVDFFIVREKDVLLVEVKDPSNKNVPEEEKARYLERLKNNELIANELTTKSLLSICCRQEQIFRLHDHLYNLCYKAR